MSEVHGGEVGAKVGGDQVDGGREGVKGGKVGAGQVGQGMVGGSQIQGAKVRRGQRDGKVADRHEGGWETARNEEDTSSACLRSFGETERMDAI